MSAQEWAQQVAAGLPALTDDEAVHVGRLAATLDARRLTGTTSNRRHDRELRRPTATGAPIPEVASGGADR